LQDAAIEAGAESIFLIIPYYGYSRQDRKFEEGEPVSARAIAEHLSLHADGMITVDPHKEYILDFFKIPAYNCSAAPQIGRYLHGKVDLVLAPDKGALERVKDIAEIINCEYDFLEKRRIDDTTIEMKTKEMEVDGKRIAIVDDIISTGGTMVRAVQEMKREGAKEVYVVCTHGLFVGNAIERLKKLECKEIVSTDTVHTSFSKIGVAPEIAKSRYL
jgi:ribose-phosphate pyrophosphokinase